MIGAIIIYLFMHVPPLYCVYVHGKYMYHSAINCCCVRCSLFAHTKQKREHCYNFVQKYLCFPQKISYV